MSIKGYIPFISFKSVEEFDPQASHVEVEYLLKVLEFKLEKHILTKQTQVGNID